MRRNGVADPDPGFWVVKIITTGVGETTSDWLVRTFPPEAAVPVAFLALAALLVVQIRGADYQPVRYWTTALAVSVFGTMAADVLHVGLGVPYVVSATGWALVLAAVFALWAATEHTLSVHTITSRRRQVFYWAVVLATFATGTAVGDLAATVLHLGYLGSGLLFTAALVVPAAIHLATRAGAMVTFWIAYVLTRPVGASFADWVAVPADHGGLGLGSGPVSLVLLLVLALLVTRLQRRHRALRRA